MLSKTLALGLACLFLFATAPGQAQEPEAGDAARPTQAPYEQPPHEPPREPAWKWLQTVTLPDWSQRDYVLGHTSAPAVDIDHGFLGIVSPPFVDGDDLRTEAGLYQQGPGGQWDQLAATRLAVAIDQEEPEPSGATQRASSVAVWGDCILVGLAGDGKGIATIYHYDPSLPEPLEIVAVFQGPPDVSGFGRAVAFDEQGALVAADDAVYVYAHEKRPDGEEAWPLVEVIHGENVGEDFGEDVDVAGLFAAVGAPQAPGGGAVYIYQRGPEGALHLQARHHDDTGTVERLGTQVVAEPFRITASAIHHVQDARMGLDELRVQAHVLDMRPDNAWEAVATSFNALEGGMHPVVAADGPAVVQPTNAPPMLFTHDLGHPAGPAPAPPAPIEPAPPRIWKDEIHGAPVEYRVDGDGRGVSRFGMDAAMEGDTLAVSEGPTKVHIFQRAGAGGTEPCIVDPLGERHCAPPRAPEGAYECVEPCMPRPVCAQPIAVGGGAPTDQPWPEEPLPCPQPPVCDLPDPAMCGPIRLPSCEVLYPAYPGETEPGERSRGRPQTDLVQDVTVVPFDQDCPQQAERPQERRGDARDVPRPPVRPVRVPVDVELPARVPTKVVDADDAVVTVEPERPVRIKEAATIAAEPPVGVPDVPGADKIEVERYLDIHVEAEIPLPEPPVVVDIDGVPTDEAPRDDPTDETPVEQAGDDEADTPEGPVPKRVTVEIRYDEAEIGADVKEDELGLHFYDGEDWVDLRTVEPGSTIKATTAEGDLTVYDAGVDTERDRVWAVVDHTSTYALGVSSYKASDPAATVPLDTPWLWIGALAFLVAAVWVTNFAILGRRNVMEGPATTIVLPDEEGTDDVPVQG